MDEGIKKFILEELWRNKTVTTHHLSDFYEDFCKMKNLKFMDFSKNQRVMRYYFNKLVDGGILEKRTVGTEFLGKTDFNHTHYTIWFLKDE